MDASTVTEKTELTLACMNLDWNLRGQIVKFNRASDKYRIVVKDYSEYSSMTYESAGSNGTMVTQSDDGLTKLNTEIMSGNVPDMILTDGLPCGSMRPRACWRISILTSTPIWAATR